MTATQRVGPCISCGKSVPDVDFYSKGRKCKLCVCAASIAWRAANPERVKAARKAYRESLSYEKKRAMNRESSVRNRELRTEKQRQWRARNEDKKQAWVTVEKAIARGELVRPDSCQECGRHKDEMQIQASHHDYSKPLDVEWLCVKCHRAKDAAMREEVVQLKDKIAALLQQLAAAERAREVACAIFAEVIDTVRDAATGARMNHYAKRGEYHDEMAARIAAFLAANGGGK